jgi:hypothetical protein
MMFGGIGSSIALAVSQGMIMPPEPEEPEVVPPEVAVDVEPAVPEPDVDPVPEPPEPPEPAEPPEPPEPPDPAEPPEPPEPPLPDMVPPPLPDVVPPPEPDAESVPEAVPVPAEVLEAVPVLPVVRPPSSPHAMRHRERKPNVGVR